MKIALVGDYPPPFGGVSVHVAALAQALRTRGVDVRVLDVGRGDHRGPAIAPARGAFPYAAQLARAAAEGRLVHVHTSGANLKSWLVALTASRARLPGSPRPLLTLHSGLLPRYLASRRGRRALAKMVCSGFGHVLAVSGQVADALERSGVARANLSVVPAFLAAQLVPGEPPSTVGVFRASHAPVFCAALAPTATYGEDLLLSAFEAVRQQLSQAGLVVFGPGSARPASHGWGVLALGEIEHGAALGVIQACDVFVRSTRADGDSLSVREALTLGRVVVASAVGQRPPGCLLFRAGDAVDLEHRMVEAARLPAPGGGRTAPVPDCFERVLAIYRSLVRRRPIPSDSAHLDQTPCSMP
jgi:glycogen(starch) synthase